MSNPVSGVLAALITPIDDRGRVDLNAFERVIEFVMDRGVDGVVIGGGTAEYPHFALDDRAALAAHAVQRLKGRGKVIASVGTSSIHSTLELARRAADAGSDALLIPMPYFFRYQQQDLAAFCQEVCGSVSTPCFLYNLPSFTNPLDVETAVELLNTVPNLVGMKDSSGQTESLAPLAKARGNGGFSLFVGDDSLLYEALRAGWDGVVSGIACFVPELILAVYRSYRAGKVEEAAAWQAALDAVIDQIVQLPIPWGVRVGLAARGIPNGPMHVPPSPSRRQQMEALQKWLGDWAASKNLKLDEVWSRIG
jgi:4-hydroxy-tetrahydrodipicolinate synthase